jgi:ATP-dependent exoDNAse (exonuclease V) alpha subunit
MQFPLVLAYAITIHKAQSASLDQVRLNLGARRDFTMGLTYVAISRVKTLTGLLFEEPFELKRFSANKTAGWDMREDDRQRREALEIKTAADVVVVRPQG